MRTVYLSSLLLICLGMVGCRVPPSPTVYQTASYRDASAPSERQLPDGRLALNPKEDSPNRLSVVNPVQPRVPEKTSSMAMRPGSEFSADEQFRTLQSVRTSTPGSTTREKDERMLSAVDQKIMQMSGEFAAVPRDEPLSAEAISASDRFDQAPLVRNELPTYDLQPTALSPEQAVALALLAAEIDQIACREKQILENAYRPITRRHFCSLIKLAKRLVDLAAQAEKENHAARVLEAYYALAHVHAQLQLLATSQAILDRRTTQIEEARKVDLATGFRRTEIQRRQLELDQKRSQLLSARSSLSAQLRALLGGHAESGDSIWTNCRLGESLDIPDLQEQTEIALAHRTDLAVMHTIAGACEKDIAKVAAVILGQSQPFFGSLQGPIPGQSSLLGRILVSNDAAFQQSSNRAQQVNSLVRGLEIKIRAEVANHVFYVQDLVTQLGIQREVIATYQTDIEQFRELRKVGRGTFADLVEAEFAELQERSELYETAYEMELGRLQLRKARGTLLRDLGLNQVHMNTLSIPQPIEVAGEFVIEPQ